MIGSLHRRHRAEEFKKLTGGRAIEEKDLKNIDGVTAPNTAAATALGWPKSCSG